MILKGWKDIAKYLGTAVRTVQRWELLGLPIRRPTPGRRAAVVALTEDWMDGSGSEPGEGGVRKLPEQGEFLRDSSLGF